MKKLSVFLAFLLVFGVVFAASQSVDGKRFEFSTGLGFESYKYNYYNDPYSDLESYINVPIRFGWYIWKGLEFEPELMLTMYHSAEYYNGVKDYSENSTGWMLSGNLVYNFKLNRCHFMPFILAGWGFGNGVPYEGYVYKWATGAKASTPNLGVGVKYIINNNAALRLEYRYRNFRISSLEGGDDPVDHVIMNTIIVGMSLFF